MSENDPRSLQEIQKLLIITRAQIKEFSKEIRLYYKDKDPLSKMPDYLREKHNNLYEELHILFKQEQIKLSEN